MRPPAPNRIIVTTRAAADPHPLLTTMLNTSGLLALWPLNDPPGSATVQELVSGLNGTVGSGVMLSGTSGIDGQPVALFSGSGTGITVPNNTLFNQPVFTWEAWLQVQNLYSSGQHFEVVAVQSDRRFYIARRLEGRSDPSYADNSNLITQQVQAGATPDIVQGDKNDPSKPWHHLLLGFDGAGNVISYVDGIAETQPGYTLWSGYATIDAPILFGGTSAWRYEDALGTETFSGVPLIGSVQYLALYNRMLTAAEAAQRWALGTSPQATGGVRYATLLYDAAGFANYYPMTEGSGTTAYDLTNTQHGVYTGVTPGAAGLIGPAPTFDGSAGYVPTTAKIVGSKAALSAEAWVKPTAIDGVAAVVVSRGDQAARTLQFQLGKTAGDGRLSLAIQLDATEYAYTSTAMALTGGDWQHVAFSLTGGQAPIVRLNGVQAMLDSGTAVPAAVLNGANPAALVQIAATGTTPGSFFPGQIQQVVISNTAQPDGNLIQRVQAGQYALGRLRA